MVNIAYEKDLLNITLQPGLDIWLKFVTLLVES